MVTVKMKPFIPEASKAVIARRQSLRRLFALAFVFICTTTFAIAAGTVTSEIIPPESDTVGTPVTIVLTVKNAKVDAIKLPHVDGLELNGSGTNPGSSSEDFTFFLTPKHAGNFTIPAFDIHTADGQTLHVQAIKLHVVAGST